jgi:hypothetical protein
MPFKLSQTDQLKHGVFMYLFVVYCGLFSDTVSILDYTASNNRMT